MNPIFKNNIHFIPNLGTNGFAWINEILYVIENGEAFPVEDERIKRVLYALYKSIDEYKIEKNILPTVSDFS